MRNIYCIGEMLIDMVAESSLDKARNFVKNPGGAPANVAVQIAKLGGKVAFIGNLGDDSFGYYLANVLNEFNIETTYISHSGKTTLAFVGIDNNGERDFEFYRGSDGKYQVQDSILDKLDDTDIVHFGSATALLGDELYESYFKLLEEAEQRQSLISFDPNFREDLICHISIEQYIQDCRKFISCANFVKLSEVEAQLISSEDDIELAIINLSQITNAVIVITLGAGGSLLVQSSSTTHLPTRSVNQIDSTGAGDAFVGAMLYQLANEADKTFEQMVLFANFVGGYTCQKFGAILAMPTMAQIMRFIDE